MTTALQCEDVSIHYEPGSDAILSGLSFSIAAGERVALVGLNGSGKTSLLMSLVGLVRHQGDISICGQVLSSRSVARLRRSVGFLFNVPEDQLLFPKVIEDVAFGLAGNDLEPERARALAAELLDRLRIGHLAEEPVHHLSHGQKQRVALAGAIVADPPLLLLDEPTAGLDPPAKLELAQLLTGLGSAQLIATHDLDFADRVCTRFLLLEQGGLAEMDGNTARLQKRWMPA